MKHFSDEELRMFFAEFMRVEFPRVKSGELICTEHVKFDDTYEFYLSKKLRRYDADSFYVSGREMEQTLNRIHERYMRSKWRDARISAGREISRVVQNNCGLLKWRYMPRRGVYRVELACPLTREERARICPGWRIYNLIDERVGPAVAEKAIVQVYSDYVEIVVN